MANGEDKHRGKLEWVESPFTRRLRPVGRILDFGHLAVWGCSPIDGPDGKVHLFCSRWPAQFYDERRGPCDGWLRHSEIAHAVGDQPEGPFAFMDTALARRGGDHWDATMAHNPQIVEHDGAYYLFYTGTRPDPNADDPHMGLVENQRIGLARSRSLYGPWERLGNDGMILDANDDKEAWDSIMVSNPALMKHPCGQFWLYYKSWCRHQDGLRKYGLAIAENIEGPYVRHPDNPLIDYSHLDTQVEDAFVFLEDGKFKMLLRDMGVFSNRSGLYIESDDGVQWSEPSVGYKRAVDYFEECTIHDRMERPQILMRGGRAAYLYVGLQSSPSGKPSGAVFRVE